MASSATTHGDTDNRYLLKDRDYKSLKTQASRLLKENLREIFNKCKHEPWTIDE